MYLKQPLNYGGRIFEAGEQVRGQLPADFIAVLQEQGVVTNDPPEDQGEQSVPSHQNETTMSLAELGEHVKQIVNPEEVEQLLHNEQGSESPRSTAIKLLEKRLKELRNE